MISQLARHSTRSFDFRTLLRSISMGELALPDFQRDFVWNPNKVVELLDSVSRGWPIGSFLMLEGPQPFGLKQISHGPKVEPTQVERYLLDGQQRLTSLYLAAFDLGDVVYFVDFLDPDERDEYPFRWENRAKYKPNEARFTFKGLLESVEFDRRLDKLRSAEAHRLRDARLHRMGPLLDEYMIPAIVMSSDIPLEALTRIFETLNRTGLRLNAFDLMVAVLRPHGFLLRDEWTASQELQPVLKELDVDGVEILKLIALWQRDIDPQSNRPSARKVTGVRQGDVLNVPGAFVQHQWERGTIAYAQTLDFLRDSAGVRGKRSMPSWAMVLPMAYWLDNGQSLSDVSHWYWQSVARQTYAQGANTQVIADLKFGPVALESPDVEAAVQTGLLDQTRRNRVLRLAIRGLSRVRMQHAFQLEYSGDSGGREVSIEFLNRGLIGADGTEPLVDMIFLTLPEIGQLRRASVDVRALVSHLPAETLSSQGFDPDTTSSTSERRAGRLLKLTSWFSELS